MAMKLGDAFMMTVPPKYNIDHLHFVISDPAKHGGTFVVVNVTSDQLRAGKHCPLQAGCHLNVKKDCFVSFPDSLEITPAVAAKLDSLVGKLVSMVKPMSPEMLASIVATAKASKAFPENLKLYL